MEENFYNNYIISDNDIIIFDENCLKIVESCTASIKKYKGTYYVDFYRYIQKYIATKEKIISKYTLLDLICDLSEKEEQLKQTLLQKQKELCDNLNNLDGFIDFLLSLKTTNEIEEESKKLMLNSIGYEDKENAEIDFLKAENKKNGLLYYENYESYFDDNSEYVDDELNLVLSEYDKEKFLEKKDENGNIISRNKTSLLLDLITYSENSETREVAFNIFSSSCGEKENNYNGKLVDCILSNRLIEANKSGFDNYFEYKAEDRILKSKKEVEFLLKSVLDIVKPKAKEELEELRVFVKNEYDIDNLKISDMEYYIDKYKTKKYNDIFFDINDYLTIENCIQAGFDLAEYMFGIKFVENKSLLDNKNVSCYDVLINDRVILNVFFDLYERKEKQYSGYTTYLLPNIGDEVGVIYMSCSFSKILEIEQIETFLHELGHIVHDAFLKIDFYNVENDLLINPDVNELVSGVFEKTFFSKKYLELIKKKKEIDYIELLNDVFNIHNFFSSYDLCKQTLHSYIDLYLHTFTREHSLEEINEIIEDIGNECIPAGMHNSKNYIFNFCHIFSDNYETQYYSYLFSVCYGSLISSKLMNDPEYAITFKKDFLEKNKNNGHFDFIHDNKNKIYESLAKYYNISPSV